MLTELAKQQNDHKARQRRIAEAAERHKWESAAKNDAALFVKFHHALSNRDEWAEQQIERHKHHWFSVVSACKVAKSGSPTIGSIQRATCEVYEVERGDILSARRSGHLIIPRHVSMYLAKEMTGLSYPQIARATGGRDHSTAIHAHRKISELIKTNERLASRVAQIMGMLA
jgi:hypothetical protein